MHSNQAVAKFILRFLECKIYFASFGMPVILRLLECLLFCVFWNACYFASLLLIEINNDPFFGNAPRRETIHTNNSPQLCTHKPEKS
ncbi:MAG: hypothetical protein DRR16_15630 [Candidatus Parabeggiatoa sp. nov. 3]|nr:MAG: hypothetical protein DRR00_25395 [Gammaproteobacteria bacterium]RKZ84117.1 MAG: hypothetical protein DRR16_15630 [Gammaproteobacteria bacterium]